MPLRRSRVGKSCGVVFMPRMQLASRVRVCDGLPRMRTERAVIGLEVKSGTASLTGEQRAFDLRHNSNNQNKAFGIGQHDGLRIDRVVEDKMAMTKQQDVNAWIDLGGIIPGFCPCLGRVFAAQADSITYVAPIA